MDDRVTNLQIGEGQIFHSRQVDTVTSFTYNSFFLYFNVDDQRALSLLLASKFKNLIGLQSKDYLEGSDLPLAQGVRDFLFRKLGYPAEEVWLQTMPQMLGFVFNPINFWIVKKQGRSEAVLCEVNNTFGERHFYWIHQPQNLEGVWHRAEKVFHVSPFQPTTGFYEFRFQFLAEQNSVDIKYFGEAGELRLITWVRGRLAELESKSALQIFLRYGWMTPLVVFRIHFQALKLWLKKVPFVPKPNLPSEKITK
jgi:uncharacterized protein